MRVGLSPPYGEEGLLSPLRRRSSEGVQKRPTVGRSTDLPWETTYSRFFRRPTVHPFWGVSEGTLSMGRAPHPFLPLFPVAEGANFLRQNLGDPLK